MGFKFQNPYQNTAFANDPTGKNQARIKNEAHLAYVRKLPSLISGAYGCEACHIRYGDPRYRKHITAKSRKPDDCYVVPMTKKEHDSQHKRNESQWWKAQGIEPIQVALELYEVSGNVEAGVEIIMKHRPQQSKDL